MAAIQRELQNTPGDDLVKIARIYGERDGDLLIVKGRIFSEEINKYSRITENIKFENCEFEKRITINYNHRLKLGFEICIFQDIEVIGKNIDVTFGEKSSFKNITCTSQGGNLIFFKVLHIKKLVLGGEIDYKIYSSNIDELKIYNERFNNRCDIKIEDCSIDRVYFEGEQNNDISFTNNKIRFLQFRKFYNKDFFWISNLLSEEEDSQIRIENSDLENIRFNDCKFGNYAFYILRSDISKAVLNSCDYIFYNDEGAQDIYRQLKSSANNSNDRISYLFYRSKELDEYHEEIKKTKKWYSNDRIILFLSKWSNFYGFKWIWAFRFIIVIALMFFSFSILTLDNWPIRFGWISYSQTMDSLTIVSEKFFDFLNPTHSLKIFNDYSTSPFTYLWDMLGRIFIGFGIYQLIKAFRKFVI